ncbi:hypothetical protein HORIV_26540 [Vreelandella olivaria]|uniref:Mur ligase central domain-containing protein n=1 Tax=Vreelandella olivaria TaxID=390919 RepID=A0ABM7GHV4_9GAMM|nr:hypothetical protein HORIV_26540 [Halomonas olivaria]
MAVPGSQRDGRDFIEQALEAGASLVLAQGAHGDVQLEGRVLKLPHLSSRLGELGRALYQVPSDLEVIAVTGTNGKSSVTHYIAALSEALGTPAGLVGTLGVGRPGALSDSGLTTPGPWRCRRRWVRWHSRASRVSPWKPLPTPWISTVWTRLTSVWGCLPI